MITEQDQAAHRADERLKQIMGALAPAFIQLARGVNIGSIDANRPGLKPVAEMLATATRTSIAVGCVVAYLAEAGLLEGDKFEECMVNAIEAYNQAAATAINDGKAGVLANFAFQPVEDLKEPAKS